MLPIKGKPLGPGIGCCFVVVGEELGGEVGVFVIQ